MEQILQQFLNFEIMLKVWPLLLRGLGTTAYLCALVIPLGLAGGLAVALLSLSRRRTVVWAAIVLVDFFRAAPPLVLLILLYSGLPFAGINLSPTVAVCLAFFCNTSSYYGEIYRAGIESVGRGHWEAARSTGLGAFQTIGYVVLPQAVRNVLPDLVSNTIEVVEAHLHRQRGLVPGIALLGRHGAFADLQLEPGRAGGCHVCRHPVAARAPRQPARAPRGSALRSEGAPMPRIVTVAAAQLGAIQKADTRQAVVARMLDLMDQAKGQGADFIVYPELALTTFFPRWYHEDRAEADFWFEKEMPNAATRPLFERAAKHGMGMSFGYAELTPDGHHFNTSILVDQKGAIVGKYRKVHLPGHVEFDKERTHQHLEKRYFEPGDLGFPVWRFMGGIFGMCICNDRRWPEIYRVMGLQGVEMVVLGSTRLPSTRRRARRGREKRIFHHKLSLQAGAYQNSTWVVAVAKAGVEDGNPLFGCSVIVNPDGEIVAETRTEEDEVVVHRCDLDATRFGKETIFDFKRHRRIEHYGRITSQVGVTLPPEA